MCEDRADEDFVMESLLVKIHEEEKRKWPVYCGSVLLRGYRNDACAARMPYAQI